MKLIFNSKTLTDTLSKLAKVIDSNPIVPILDGILFTAEAHAEAVTLVASNLSQTLTATVPAEGIKADLKVCIPAKILLDTLKGLPNQPIGIAIDSEGMTIKVISENGTYKIAIENAIDFPKTNTNPTGETAGILQATDIKVAIELTKIAVSKDQIRPAMTGVCFEVNDMSTSFAASNGHLLNMIGYNNMAFNDNARVIIPAKTMQVLAGILTDDEVNIHTDGQQITFATANMLLSSKLIDERFPDLSNIFPDPAFDLLLDRLALIATLKRVVNFANETTQAIMLSVTDHLIIAAEDLDYGHEASETMPYKVINHTDDASSHQGFKIGLNANLLIQMLSVLHCDKVRLCLTECNRPMLINTDAEPIGTNYAGLIMPVILYSHQ